MWHGRPRPWPNGPTAARRALGKTKWRYLALHSERRAGGRPCHEGESALTEKPLTLQNAIPGHFSLPDAGDHSASAHTPGALPGSKNSTWTTLGLQQTGQSSTYRCSMPPEGSSGMTICSPQVGQTYNPSSFGRRCFFFRFFMGPLVCPKQGSMTREVIGLRPAECPFNEIGIIQMFMMDWPLMFLLLLAPALLIHRLFGTGVWGTLFWGYVVAMLLWAGIARLIERQDFVLISKWASERQMVVTSFEEPFSVNRPFEWRWWKTSVTYFLKVRTSDNQELTGIVDVEGVLFAFFILEYVVDMHEPGERTSDISLLPPTT